MLDRSKIKQIFKYSLKFYLPKEIKNVLICFPIQIIGQKRNYPWWFYLSFIAKAGTNCACPAIYQPDAEAEAPPPC